jgi:hypothetical protein
MSASILQTSGKAFQKFTCHLTLQLSKPASKFIRQLLCGIVFSGELILTHVASRVPHKATIAAIAKRFRRQLSNGLLVIGILLSNYFAFLRRRTDIDSTFIVDLTDIAKPYAKKMENLSWVRDGDKKQLVTGYWCVEVYCLDRDGIVWPVILWPYSLEAEGELSENDRVLKVLSMLDKHFGQGYGIYVLDRGFDRWVYIEAFLACKRHFIIRQRGDRTVILDNGVHIIMSDLVEHLFAHNPGQWLVYKKVYLPDIDKPLYVVAYWTKGYDEPVTLLTDMVVESFDQALQIRNRFARRWDCETSIEFLKSKIALERFAVRRYRSMQYLILLAGLAMAFLSYLQSRCKDIHQRITDRLRYWRDPKRFWFYRVLIALQDAFVSKARLALLPWCKQPP